MFGITLLSDPAATLIRMTVRVCLDSTLCVGGSNPDLSNCWATNLEDMLNEHGFVDAREVQFIWHVSSGASTLDIKKHVQEHLHGQTPESFDERIMFMSMFNDVEWTKNGSTETYSHNAQEVAVFARQFKPGHWCFLGHPSGNSWWNGNSNESQGK